ncbi:IS66 family insertion sequence element accessory protein TnpB [Delftia sp. WSY_7]|uniref:IS66 family insertion sequence element accessory protein TnpB n=1 Tax=Delftia sp. WSY_7 TaxID=3367202 RepID=UPI00370B173C
MWRVLTPTEMRAGTGTALARVVAVFGAAHPHTYLFANKRGTRLDVLVHEGMGIWLAGRAPAALGPLPLAFARRHSAAISSTQATRYARAGLAVAAPR